MLPESFKSVPGMILIFTMLSLPLVSLAAAENSETDATDLTVAVNGDAARLAVFDPDAGDDPVAAELAIMRGLDPVAAENAAVYYLQAMLILPPRDEKFDAVNGTADRFQLLQNGDFRGVLPLSEIDSLVRSALHCRLCDFHTDTSQGVSAALPHLRQAPWLAEYMAICADYDLVHDKPWSALRRYMDLREFSRDIAAGVGIVSTLSGIRLEEMQQQRLLQALPLLIKQGVPVKAVDNLFNTEQRPAPSVQAAFTAETVFRDSISRAVAALAEGDTDLFWSRLQTLYSLRRTDSLKKFAVNRGALREDELEDVTALAHFAAEELLIYRTYVSDLKRLADLKPAQRNKALAKLHKDIVADPSHGILTYSFAPVLPQFADSIFTYRRNTCAMRLLLAAITIREETGNYPADINSLLQMRPDLDITDPLTGDVFLYSQDNENVTISWKGTRENESESMTFTWPDAG
ncbi:MAG TPA: hypothetical protein ENJ06_06385 [Phycisphaeraceae bacterium]|nr:hypothetical protein [Phycisphaeraceae bacterium]